LISKRGAEYFNLVALSTVVGFACCLLYGLLVASKLQALPAGRWFLMTVTLVFYLIPTIIVFVRRTPHRVGVAIFNVLGGWTCIGWVLAFVCAVIEARKAPDRLT
jgi:hypothetical protein